MTKNWLNANSSSKSLIQAVRNGVSLPSIFLSLLIVPVKARPCAYDTKKLPSTTKIVANFDPNIPVPSLFATDVLFLSPVAAEVLAFAPVLPAALVSLFAVAVVIAVVIAVVVWTDVVSVIVVEVLVDPAAVVMEAVVDDDEETPSPKEAESVAPELAMPNAD